ncbi:hypothetical protein [Nocardia mangyaensis]|uniref:hypothetical protein n=1 Tax=Nocardia mangyaensis TaxID=2213200 RepID=UPI00198055F0|nr:hypothetical protein [Nocardia mangyaensis]
MTRLAQHRGGDRPWPVIDIVSRWTTPIPWSLDHVGRQRFGKLERRILEGA